MKFQVLNQEFESFAKALMAVKEHNRTARSGKNRAHCKDIKPIANNTDSLFVEKLDQNFQNRNIKNLMIPALTLVPKDTFKGNNITYILIGADVEIENDEAMGNFGKQFRQLYAETTSGGNGRFAGAYMFRNNKWERVA